MQSYKEYLLSDKWDSKKKKVLERAKHRCQICNSEKRIEVHHRKYPKVLGTEPICDLTVLCHSCHELYTFKIQKYCQPLPVTKNNKKHVKYTISPHWGINIYEADIEQEKRGKTYRKKLNILQTKRNDVLKNLKIASEKGEDTMPYVITMDGLLKQLRSLNEEYK